MVTESLWPVTMKLHYSAGTVVNMLVVQRQEPMVRTMQKVVTKHRRISEAESFVDRRANRQS